MRTHTHTEYIYKISAYKFPNHLKFNNYLYMVLFLCEDGFDLILYLI